MVDGFVFFKRMCSSSKEYKAEIEVDGRVCVCVCVCVCACVCVCVHIYEREYKVLYS